MMNRIRQEDLGGSMTASFIFKPEDRGRAVPSVCAIGGHRRPILEEANPPRELADLVHAGRPVRGRMKRRHPEALATSLSSGKCETPITSISCLYNNEQRSTSNSYLLVDTC